MKTVGKKNDTFRKIRYKALMGVMVFSIFVSCLMLHDINNTVLATDEVTEVAENTSPFGNVTINPGANIYYGDLLDGSALTSVEGNTLLSQYTVPSKGDQASIDAAITEYKNSKFGDTQTDKIKNIVNNDSFKLPSIADIKKWNSVIPSVGGEYWLSDTSTATILGREEKYNIEVPVRALAASDNTLPNNTVEINGKYVAENSDDLNNGGLFMDRKLQLPIGNGQWGDLGSYINVNSTPLKFGAFIQHDGYIVDLIGDEQLKYGKTDIVDLDYQANGEDARVKFPILPGDSRVTESRRMLLYSTPDCNPGDIRQVTYERKGVTHSKINAMIYDKTTDTYRVPNSGETVPIGTTLAILVIEDEREWKNGMSYKSTIENKNGLTAVDAEVYLANFDQFSKPTVNPRQFKGGGYLLYHTTLKEYKMIDNANFAAQDRAGQFITGGWKYIPTKIDVPSTTLTGETKVVRPKMNIDTSKVMFARNNMSNANATPNATLGGAPTTTLASGGKYKLVVKDDTLGVEGIYEGATIEAEGGSAQFDGESTITVTPGTTKIRIPVATKMPITSGVYKVSAVSTGKDGNVKYGIVGDVEDEYSEIEIDISNLMDINQLTGTGNGKKITLYHEQLNKQAISDTISKDGKEYTIKVANPQTIDFTTTTKNALLTTTYPYGTEFEVSAEVANKGEFDLIDKTTPITFTVESEYLTQTGSNWNPETLTQTAKFKVVKPQNNANDDKLKIKINRAGTNKNDAALEVTSTKVKTEKRKIDLKIDSSIFDADKGSERISLKVQDKMPDITQKYKMYKEGTSVEDAVANGDKDKIPYSILTTHWIGDYAANGVSKDKIPIENGKVLLSANGNIWKANITKSTDAEKNTWFDERYVVASTTPKDAIIDVYDNTAGVEGSMILYTNNIMMTLDDYKTNVSKLPDGNPLKTKMMNLAKLKMTNAGAPYEESTGVFSTVGTVKIESKDEHAGTYQVDYDSKFNGIKVNTELKIYDSITDSEEEKIFVNNYIHQKNAKWPDGLFGSPSISDLTQVGGINKKTGEDIKVSINKGVDLDRLGTQIATASTGKGTSTQFKFIVRDHVKETNGIRVSANNIQLTVEEATELVTRLGEKSEIQDKIDILTPDESLPSNDPKLKIGMYPKAINKHTGNRVKISGIEGLPTIPSGKTDVATGVYKVTFKTASGEIVQPTITVYAQDPSAFVKVPAKIELKKSEEVGIEASSSVETIELEPGNNGVLENLGKKLVVKIYPSLLIKGTTTGNTSTSIRVNVYNSEGIEFTGETDKLLELVTLDKVTTSKNFTLKIKKGASYPLDLYEGKMTFNITYNPAFPVPKSGE